MLRRFLLVLLFIAVLLPLPTQAQEINTIFTESGRLSIDVPETWVSRHMPEEEEIEGVDSESLVFGTSHNVIDQYLNNESFDGTVFFLGAYPYQVYQPEVLGDLRQMMMEVTVYQEEDIQVGEFANFPAATFLYDDDSRYFIWEVLLDIGEITYRGIVYSTRKDEFELVQEITHSIRTFPVALEATLDSSQATRTLTTDDSRLSFTVPENWLYWNESENTLSFSTSGTGYKDVSYSFMPQASQEIVFLAHRMVKSALRPGDRVNGVVDLPKIVQRLVDENEGLRKDTPLTVVDWQGISRLDASWLVAGSQGSVLTQTVLLEAQDVVYMIQAQYAADKRTQLQPTVDRIFDSMAYTAPETTIDSTREGLEPGQLAPDFTLPILSGEDVKLSDFRGKVIFMNMWASWCGPCHREAPAMQTYYDSYGGRFEILAVNVGESEIEASGFVRQYALTFPVLLDPTMAVAELYELRGYPTTYVIGRDGVVLEVIVGSLSEQSLKDVLALYVGR